MPGRKRQEERATRGLAQTDRSFSPSQEDEDGGKATGVRPGEGQALPLRGPAAQAAEVERQRALGEEAQEKEGSQAPHLG